MENVRLFFICVLLQHTAYGQAYNFSSPQGVTLLEVPILAFLVANALLSIASIIGIWMLFRKVNKMWLKLSEKVTVTHHHIERNEAGVSNPGEDEESPPTANQMPTRPPSVKLPANEKQESRPLSEPPSCMLPSIPSLFRHTSPPDYEDTMSRRARQVNVSQHPPKEDLATVTLSEDDDPNSPYMDMRSCRISRVLPGMSDDDIYDFPHYSSASYIHFTREAQTQASLRRAKQSRYHSDPSTYPLSTVFSSFRAGDAETFTACPPDSSRDSGQGSFVSSQSLRFETSESDSTCRAEKLSNSNNTAAIVVSAEEQTAKSPPVRIQIRPPFAI